jgi:hypothetical protein
MGKLQLTFLLTAMGFSVIKSSVLILAYCNGLFIAEWMVFSWILPSLEVKSGKPIKEVIYE